MKIMISNPILFRRTAARLPEVHIPFQYAMALLVVMTGLLLGLAVERFPIGNPVTYVSSLIPAPTKAKLPPELPIEWMPVREPITFDHMYMDSTPTNKLDWIRSPSPPSYEPAGRR